MAVCLFGVVCDACIYVVVCVACVSVWCKDCACGVCVGWCVCVVCVYSYNLCLYKLPCRNLRGSEFEKYKWLF